ncbi:hypothetical protein KQ941_00165 [Paenibacillus xylanexedens]|uniref:hypothetical protein n=1 Tax=Paenibacillus xylanexedens TaxID=528191 RepID=UPI001F3FE65D|nr:hypothetical protein [Paenibacillus xylanexedens]MCF7752838.1 hypothetical protein [Paenibacillus xylanexedens]
MKSTSRTIGFAALSLLLLLLAACTNASTSSPAEETTSTTNTIETSAPAENTNKTTYPLTIENFTISGEGGEWKPKVQVFDKTPERVVANT